MCIISKHNYCNTPNKFQTYNWHIIVWFFYQMLEAWTTVFWKEKYMVIVYSSSEKKLCNKEEVFHSSFKDIILRCITPPSFDVQVLVLIYIKKYKFQLQLKSTHLQSSLGKSLEKSPCKLDNVIIISSESYFPIRGSM